MKRSEDNVGKIESVSTIIVNFGQMLLWFGQLMSWLLTFFTAFVLTSQPQPISLPGILDLGPSYKLIFLISILLGYVQLLRRDWENQRRRGKDFEATFGSYIYGSTIKAKRPLILVGFISILSVIFTLIFSELIVLSFLIVIAGILVLVSFSLYGIWTKIKRKYDDEFRKRWLKRVKNKLYDDGCTYTPDFWNLPDAYTDEINWAIKLYFELYEFEQDLIFSEKTISRNFRDYEICEIRFGHIPSQLANI